MKELLLKCIYPLTLIALTVLQSCTSSKQLTYFQRGTNFKEDTINFVESYIPTIKKGDILSIQISSLNTEASAFFNPYAKTVVDQSLNANSYNPLPTITGYLVGQDGNIKLPLIGTLKAVGLTNTQLSESIQAKLKDYLREPTVNVRNQSFRVSVLGEVARPALFTIPNEQITLPEALGLAGDLTIYGRRDNVLIIREEKGKRVFTRLDLTKRDAFRSPYYSLHPNDIVYVEPGKSRIASADRAFQVMPTVVGILSVIAIIATRR